MSKRKLKRQMNLGQVVMMGAAGTIGAQIFVLTGHAAGISGPATILAFLVGGLLSYSIAINYSELATMYPVTGGALTYVREAYGNNILSFLVGAMDCLSSTFYAALSAVGFAWSLRVLLPDLPIVPVAILTITIFTLLNLLGVNKVSSVQVGLGAVLLALLAIYVLAGWTQAGGFDWQTFLPDGRFFIHDDFTGNLSAMLATIALVYSAYVGFEVIADDAEEVQNPSRTIPRGILISLTLVIVIYMLVVSVTIGSVSWQELAGSETALTDAVRRFLPDWGVWLISIAGIIATLTSVNSAMLSATREAFTLSRDGTLPRFMSHLSRFRTPYGSILAIGAISALVAAIGLVDFLSYASSSGYLFVLFWSNSAMIRLRKQYPDMPRPFKAPLFPLTSYIASLTCLLIIAFTEISALLFGSGVLAVCAVFYYSRKAYQHVQSNRAAAAESARDRILIPVANPATARHLVRIGSILAQASEDTSICVLKVRTGGKKAANYPPQQPNGLLQAIIQDAQARNVPLYTKVRDAAGVADGILTECQRHNLKLILAGWPGPVSADQLAENPIKVVLQKANTNVAVLLERNLGQIRQILVPLGGGAHSRLALRLACEIAAKEGAKITALHIFPEQANPEEIEDAMLHLEEIIEDELGSRPAYLTARVCRSETVPQGILLETSHQPYDLVIIGASDEWISDTRLFGSVSDWIADHVPCSVLLVRCHERVAMAWIRQQVRKLPVS